MALLMGLGLGQGMLAFVALFQRPEDELSWLLLAGARMRMCLFRFLVVVQSRQTIVKPTDLVAAAAAVAALQSIWVGAQTRALGVVVKLVWKTRTSAEKGSRTICCSPCAPCASARIAISPRAHEAS